MVTGVVGAVRTWSRIELTTGPPGSSGRSQYQLVEEGRQLVEVLAGSHFVTTGLIGAHLAVTREPEVLGFRVQPDDPTTFLPHFIQNVFFRIAVVGSAVADNDQGGLLVENFHVIFFKLAKREPVIRGRVVFDIRFFQDLVNGLVDITVLKNIGDFIQSGHEDKTAHLGKTGIDRVLEIRPA